MSILWFLVLILSLMGIIALLGIFSFPGWVWSLLVVVTLMVAYKVTPCGKRAKEMSRQLDENYQRQKSLRGENTRNKLRRLERNALRKILQSASVEDKNLFFCPRCGNYLAEDGSCDCGKTAQRSQ